jgi:hypothetical protein
MKYGAFDDPYCIPGTRVLKNILGIRSRAALDQFRAIAAPSAQTNHTHWRFGVPTIAPSIVTCFRMSTNGQDTSGLSP